MSDAYHSPCLDCRLQNGNFCKYLVDQSSSFFTSAPDRAPNKTHLKAAERGTVSIDGTLSNETVVLCDGWAFRYRRLADNRRQILSILIPGDVVSAFGIFDSCPEYSVEALTDINFCQFDRSTLRRELLAKPGLVGAIGTIWTAEMDDLSKTSVDLVECNAKERFVRFVSRLIHRMDHRGLALGERRYRFPLTSGHIADAIGLAPDEVDDVIAILRQDDVIDLSGETLSILDPSKFEAYASNA
jgi:CRP/FNR family transcriptional regulator